MTNTKSTKHALFMSVLSLFLCCSMLIGTTFAWFTDTATNSGNRIVAGNLDVELTHSNPFVTDETVLENTKLFTEIDEGKWEPGAIAYEIFTVKNAGNLALTYTFDFNVSGATVVDDVPFTSVLKVAVVEDGFEYTREKVAAITDWSDLSAYARGNSLAVGAKETFGIIIWWDPSENSNLFNMNNDRSGETASVDLGINLFATQDTVEKDAFDDQYDAEAAVVCDEWDGTADTTWYSDTATEFTLNTAEQIAGLAELTDSGTTFEGKTIKLSGDVDLYLEDENGDPISFEPIGSYRKDTPFKGTFDGQGYTIYNMYQSGWALDNSYNGSDLGLGLFGKVEDATIKNLNIDGAEMTSDSNLTGTVAGAAYGNCTFENIAVTNTKMGNYQYYSGGIVGWASGDHQYINCDVDETNAIASHWGDFDNSNGGLIGGAGGSATIYLKDCDVACVMDVYNDVTSSYRWYAYRRSGMLIGNTGKTETIDTTTYADAPQLTCENCTVTYGDWANYTYCEFAGTNWPYVRVQAGYSNDAYSNPRYGVATDANGNKAVDDTHVHHDGEDHNILCTFDQLYGGGQGVYGRSAHAGVTVTYNNK